MTYSSQIMNSAARYFVGAWTFVLFCRPALAQEKPSSAPLTADEVMQRVVQMNELRAKAIDDYSSIRTYHLESRGLSHEVADMVVRVDYKAVARHNSKPLGKVMVAEVFRPGGILVSHCAS